MKRKKVFLICPVSSASDRDRKELSEYVDYLTNEGFNVYYPYKDTPQDESPLNINQINTRAIQRSDEIHIFYKRTSQGIHFDMGNIFSLKELHKNKFRSILLRLFGIKNPKVVLVRNQEHIADSKYTIFLEEWLGEIKEEKNEQ